MPFEKASPSELKKIRKYMVNPDLVESDRVGVVSQLVANNRLTTQGFRLAVPLLKAFQKKLSSPKNGKVPLMFNHPLLSGAFAAGTAFDVALEEDTAKKTEYGDSVHTLYAKFFVINGGQETVSLQDRRFLGGTNVVVMATEDIATKYNAGQIPGGSVGFSTKLVRCSVCKEPVSYGEFSCDHKVGEKVKGVLCTPELGADDKEKSDGDLREYSLLNAGAIADAGPSPRFNLSADGHFEVPEDYKLDLEAAQKGTTFLCAADDINRVFTESEDEGEDMSKELVEALTQLKDLEVNSVKLTGEIEKLTDTNKTLTAQVDAVTKERDDLKTQLAEKDTALAAKDSEACTAVRALALASHVQAHGQTSEDELTKLYGSLTVVELAAKHDENVRKFHQDVTPGEHKLAEDAPKPLPLDFQARRVAQSLHTR